MQVVYLIGVYEKGYLGIKNMKIKPDKNEDIYYQILNIFLVDMSVQLYYKFI